MSGEVTEELLSSFQVVVMIDAALDEQLRVNDLCRKKGVCYISCDVRGVFASAFCDFGDAFVVSDVDGNQAASCVVSSVTKDAIGLVTVMDDQRHNLVTGDVVTFNSVQGMTEVSIISNCTVDNQASFFWMCVGSDGAPEPRLHVLFSIW